MSKINIPCLLGLLRPQQWIKNTFVFAPLIFSGLFHDKLCVQRSIIAFVIFCVASSAAYIVNDLIDSERDRKHPVKCRTRPIAAGLVSTGQARCMLLLCYSILALMATIDPRVILVALAYLVLNLAYSLKLKHEPVVDLFSIAVGFVLRVYAGAQAISVPVSSWMFITTLCLALFLAAIKRRQEVRRSNSDTREVLQVYSVELVDKFAEIAATGALLFYSMFVLTTKPELIAGIPLVIFGIFRYWYIVYHTEAGESPAEALLHDRTLLLTVLAWVVFSLISL
jgi:decaprenyl-phosphate phosphoribosyltransferase